MPSRRERYNKGSYHVSLRFPYLASAPGPTPTYGFQVNVFVEPQNQQRNSMSKKLYVGNLSYETTSDDLRDAFSVYGPVTSAEVIVDRDTGRSRGFGFVEMAEGGAEAIKALDLTELQGRNITVNEARPREERGGKRGSYGRRRY